MSRETWANFKPPDWIDRDAFLFMGADPAWTPEREGRPAPTPAPAIGPCPHCKGKGDFLHDASGNLVRDAADSPVFLRGAIANGSHAVCPKCYRYGLDRVLDRTPLSAMMHTTPTSPDDDSGAAATSGARSRKSPSVVLDLSGLATAVAPPPEPGYVTKAVAAGSVSVPERWAHLLDGR